MDDYSLWWLIAGSFLFVATLSGALLGGRTKPGQRRVGVFLAITCIGFSTINLMQSLPLELDMLSWKFVLTILHTILMFLFGLSSWIIRRTKNDGLHSK